MATGLRKGITQSMHTRTDKKLWGGGCGFEWVQGDKSLGGKRYTLIVCDDFSRYSWVHFMRHKPDATELFEQFLSDTRADGVPSEVVIVRSYVGEV